MNLAIFSQLRSMVGSGMGKMALTSLHKNLENTVKHPVNFFQMIYTTGNEMYFSVLCPDGLKRDCAFPDGKKIISIVEGMIKEGLPEGSNLDALVLEYDNNHLSIVKNPFKIIAAYTDSKGEKIKVDQIIEL